MTRICFPVFFIFFCLAKFSTAEDDQILIPIGSILYPHGIHDNYRLDLDNITKPSADSGSGRISLPFNLTFFGHRYNYIYVSNNGHFYFADREWTLFNYRTFPQPDYPYQDDVALIAPFYARIDIDTRDDRQRVYWRHMKRDLSIDDPGKPDKLDHKQRQRRDNYMLEDIENVVHRSIVGGDLFFAKYAVCATWRNLTFAGAAFPNDPRDDRWNPKNTVQAVLVTDENATYAIFNYDKIEWAADKKMGWHKTYARVGFNRGNGTDWSALDRFSGRKEVINIANSSNSDAWGRYIFRIDGLYDSIKPGGCNNDSAGELQVFPRYAGMMGGEQLNVSGPCFQPSDRILCKFDDIIVEGIYEHLQRCRCIVPTLFKVGKLTLSVSVNGRPWGMWKTQFMIVTPDRVDYRVQLQNPSDWTHVNPPPETLAVKWDRLAFAQEKFSAINVYLYGYYEDPDNSDPTQRIQFRNIKELARDEDNDGTFSFRTYDVRRDEYRDRWENYWEKRHFEMGAIAVSIAGRSNITLWSPLMALGWYMYWDMKDDYGEVWMSEKCSQWYFKDRVNSDWRHKLPPCPCKLTQALKDVGRFIADPSCDFRTDSLCLYNKDAYHCVLSVHGTPDGSGNQCCYNKEGRLMYTQDAPGGGTADRAHTWGSAPYAQPYKVPALSHYFHDVLPFHHCCIWTDYSYESWYNYKFYFNCRWYLESRNTTGCDRYEPPGPAYVFGDPHFRTFNNSAYTFNGKGEYRLLECDNIKFRMHGLFEQAPNNTYGQVNATGLTAVAMKEGSRGSEVEVRVNLPSCRWRNRLQIIVDDHEVLFNSSLNKWQWFTNLSIFGETDDNQNTNVTLMFPSGTGIQVVESFGLLHVYVSASPWFYRRTEGLFGYWDRFKDNDLMLPTSDEGHWITNLDHENIFKQFGIYWRIQSERESVLTRPIGRNFSWIHLTYNLREFYPHFGLPPMPKNTSFTEADVQRVCQMSSGELNLECAYDYRSTANRPLAEATKLQYDWWNAVYEGVKPVNSCGVLPVRGDWEGATRFPQSYMSGDSIKVSCKKGYNFWGQENWHCNQEGDWEGSSWGRDEEWPMCMTIRHTAEYSGMVGGAALAGLILILITLFWLLKKNKTAAPRQSPYRHDYDDDFYDDGPDGVVMSDKERRNLRLAEKESSSLTSSSRGVEAAPGETTPFGVVAAAKRDEKGYVETEGL